MRDLITDGVPKSDLRASGDRAVFNALVSTAASAQLRGWSEPEWQGDILAQSSTLGMQARTRNGRKAKTPAAVSKMLNDAWTKAHEWRKTVPDAWSTDEVRAQAESRAKAAFELADDVEANLSDSERVVLRYAAQQAVLRGMLRVALPWREVQGATGLSERRTKTALQQLADKGVLRLEIKGKSSAIKGKRRANIFSLHSPEALRIQCRETRPMGPRDHTYGTAANVFFLGPSPIPMGWASAPTARSSQKAAS